MSEKQSYSTREVVRQLSDDMKQHIKDSNAFREQMAAYMGEMKYHKEKQIDYFKTVDHLDKAHNRQKGAMWVVGTMGVTTFLHSLKSWLGL